jgi:hypothetical protein
MHGAADTVLKRRKICRYIIFILNISHQSKLLLHINQNFQHTVLQHEPNTGDIINENNQTRLSAELSAQKKIQ